MYVQCAPACYVYVDSQPVARGEPDARLLLEPGTYRVELREPGYLVARHDVVVRRAPVTLVHTMWPAVPEARDTEPGTTHGASTPGH